MSESFVISPKKNKKSSSEHKKRYRKYSKRNQKSQRKKASMGKKVVMAFGTFDVYHPGHAHYLQEAKSYGDQLVVVVARDDTVRAIKGKSPRNPQEDRRSILERESSADIVVI